MYNVNFAVVVSAMVSATVAARGWYYWYHWLTDAAPRVVITYSSFVIKSYKTTLHL